MYHYLYKVINTLNSKFYIGIHSTDDLNDNYLGSGRAIKEAVQKYGSHNFKKIILEYFDTREEALQKESDIVNETLINNSLCYNLTIGGNAPPNRQGVAHTDKSKNKISKYLNENIEKCKQNGKNSWKVREAKGGWTKEEIERRVETRKIQGSYKNNMSEANTEDAIRKRVETRKRNGSFNSDPSHLKSEEIVYKRTRTRIINQIKKGQKFDNSVLEKYGINEYP